MNGDKNQRQIAEHSPGPFQRRSSYPQLCWWSLICMKRDLAIDSIGLQDGMAVRPLIFWLTLTTVFFMVLLMISSSPAGTLQDLRSGLPEKIMAWSQINEDRIYTPQTIFGYINGGAEVYKAYNMRLCLTRQYLTPGGPAITLDIFDMGSSKDAYGVFTHDLAGDNLKLGQDGRWRPGWANFWKDRFFVSIYSEEDTATAQAAVKLLGQHVDALIQTRGAKPQIIDRLPLEGLQATNIRYFHHPVILNYHFYLSDENLLNLSPHTEAVLANYERNDGQALVLLVSYPEPDDASNAHAKFNRHYLVDADKNGIVQLENQKWSASKNNGRLLVIVLEADSRLLAKNLLKFIK